MKRIICGCWHASAVCAQLVLASAGEKYASADEEYVLGNNIPLWLFGFLY